MVQEGQLALANIMYCNLKDKNLNQVQVKPNEIVYTFAHSLKSKIIKLGFWIVKSNLLSMVQEGQIALANIMYCKLKNKEK